MLSCTFMYWATIRLLPFHTMSIGLYTTLTNTIFFFLASYTTFSASSNCCKIYIIFHFIVLFNFKVYFQGLIFPVHPFAFQYSAS